MALRVTVLTTVYNEERYLASAIESILRQTFEHFEFLIVDDGSVDGSRAVVDAYTDQRIRVLRNERNLGLPGALNRGLAESRGELIAVFDANDISHRERLARQVAFLDAHPDVAAVGTQMRWIDASGRRMRSAEVARPVTDEGIDWYLIFDAPLVHSATMYRSSVVRDELGGYDESWPVGQDAELWTRIRRGHRLANLPDVLFDCRIDPGSTSGNVKRLFELGHHERWRALTHKSLCIHLDLKDVPDEWASIWVRVNQPGATLHTAEARSFSTALGVIYRRFIEVHPNARGNREVKRQLAAIRSRVAFRLASDGNRVASLAGFAGVLRSDWRFALRTLPKYAALLLFGEAARRIWRRLRRMPDRERRQQ